MDGVIVHAGGGIDKLTGGAGNDAFFAGGRTTMTGKTGANKFVFYGPGPANVVADFAASAQNEIVFGNFGFSLGQSGESATPEQLPGNLFVENAAGKFTKHRPALCLRHRERQAVLRRGRQRQHAGARRHLDQPPGIVGRAAVLRHLTVSRLAASIC